jgi:hypothetical protein
VRRIAIVVAICFLAACFPHNKKARRTAYVVESATLLSGFGVLALASPGADCMRGPTGDDCRSTANTVSAIGVALLLAGVAGLVTTVSTAEEAAEVEALRAKKLDEQVPIAQPAAPPTAAAKPTKN